MLAIADCNNFYASCERAFRSDLIGRPIVVLSNNDGCIIARSAEAKALGFQMGDAYFETRQKLENNNVKVFSSNYALYGDMSARVMKTLNEFCPLVEIYSIDEAFLDLTGFNNLESLTKNIKYQTEQWTGIPISIGVAPTKTLAKIANRIAKKQTGTYIFKTPDPKILQSIDAGDVWGIGRKLKHHLKDMNIHTALDLAMLDPRAARKRFNVVVERTVRELNGIQCIAFDQPAPHPKNIMVSRGFKTRITSKKMMQEAVGLYASRTAEKARTKKVFASNITLFIRTSPFNKKNYYSNSMTITFPEATNDTLEIIKASTWLLKRLFRPGYDYQKAGIMLTGLVFDTERQRTLFKAPSIQKSTLLMKTMDSINQKYGRETIKIASTGTNRSWSMARENLSPKYTTSWKDLPIAKA